MRNLLLAIAVAMLPACPALAEQPVTPKPDKHTSPDRLPPPKRAGTFNSCAAYGVGFVKVEGTDTCVKIGGAVSIGVGGSSGLR
jgi:hypothetical protein